MSVAFIYQIIESQAALSVHLQVREQLESSVAFYKEFFDAKKREFSARGEAIAKDSVLIRAAAGGAIDDVKDRLDQVIADNRDLRSVTVRRGAPDDAVIAEVEGPAERQGPDFAPKTLTFPLGIAADSPRIELVFLLPKHYIEDRDHADEIAVLYDSAIKAGTDIQRRNFYAYALLTAGVLLIAIGMGYVLARQVTKRITRLASATMRVARGELDFEVPVRGRDEITELTQAFNEMIAEVKEARDRIVYLEKVSGWQEFARRLAHEIKNPLTPIQLAIQELRRRTPADDPAFSKLVHDAAEVVEEEIEGLTRLVDEFSQFARLPEVVPDRVEMTGFLQDFLAAYNRFEPDAKVTLETPVDDLHAAVDRVLLRRVLANLATNAIQAAGAGKAELWIGCKKKSGGEIEIRIEDNGPGVPEEHAERIFEPYFTTKTEGTGLGLAIVKKIVLQHGGTIAYEKGPRTGGAAFAIVLPPPERVLKTAEHRSE